MHICACQEFILGGFCMAPLNERLQELRQEKQLSQTEVASIVGLSLRAYQYYERGERQPAADTLISLADFFGVSIDYLAGRSNCPDMLAFDKDGNMVVIEAMVQH